MNPFDVTSILKRILGTSRGVTELFFAPGQLPKLTVGLQMMNADAKDLKRFTAYQTELMAYALLSDQPAAREHFQRTGSASFSLAIAKAYYFRVHIFRHLEGITVVFRVVPLAPPTLESLGILSRIGPQLAKRTGLVLVCSPARNGKTTTQAAILHHLAVNHPCHIISVECPVEYREAPDIPALVQYVEVQAEEAALLRGLDMAAHIGSPAVFATHLDSPTLLARALDLCEAGSLVVGGLCGSSIGQILERIRSWFPEPLGFARLASNLNSMACQNLLPTKDGRGLVAAFEILHGNPSVRQWLVQGANPMELADIYKRNFEDGMQSFHQDVSQLISQGQIKEQELNRYKSSSEKQVKLAPKSGSRDLELDENTAF